jgi:hypothetical protein
MKKKAKKKATPARATKVRKPAPRKPAAAKSRPTASRAAKRETGRSGRNSPAAPARGRGPTSEAAGLARSALEAFDAGQLDKARRDIMTLSEMLANG